MIDLPSAELVRKPLSWRLKRGSGLVARCLALACGITLAVETVRFVAERPSGPAWVETRQTCEILNRRIEGVTGIGGAGAEPFHRVWVAGEVRWYDFAPRLWTMTLAEDAPPGHGYADIVCTFISGTCFQRVVVHLPAPTLHE